MYDVHFYITLSIAYGRRLQRDSNLLDHGPFSCEKHGTSLSETDLKCQARSSSRQIIVLRLGKFSLKHTYCLDLGFNCEKICYK